MRSKYYLWHSAVMEAWYFEKYYDRLLKQPYKYKVEKERGYKPFVCYIEKLAERYRYTSLRLRKESV